MSVTSSLIFMSINEVNEIESDSCSVVIFNENYSKIKKNRKIIKYLVSMKLIRNGMNSLDQFGQIHEFIDKRSKTQNP
jgi:hypothetical protein